MRARAPAWHPILLLLHDVLLCRVLHLLRRLEARKERRAVRYRPPRLRTSHVPGLHTRGWRLPLHVPGQPTRWPLLAPSVGVHGKWQLQEPGDVVLRDRCEHVACCIESLSTRCACPSHLRPRLRLMWLVMRVSRSMPYSMG